MKAFFGFLIFLSPLILNGQQCEIPLNAGGDFEVQEVVQIEGANKDRLFAAAKLALMDVINSPLEGIKLSDKDQSIIITNIELMAPLALMRHFSFLFKVKLEFKEGRYRITVNYLENRFLAGDDALYYCKNDFTQEKCSPYGTIISNNTWAKGKCGVIDEIDHFIQDFAAQITLSLKSMDDDKW